MTDHYADWCRAHGVTHGHCKWLCEHPQPFAVVLAGETAVRLVCGRCWAVDGVVTEMTPCVPEVCGE